MELKHAFPAQLRCTLNVKTGLRNVQATIYSVFHMRSASRDHESDRAQPTAHFARHFTKPLVSSSRFKFFPMNTILHRRSSPGCQAPCCEFAKSMWIAWKTNFSFIPFTARTPLERKRSVPFSFRSHPIHSLSFCCTTSPGKSKPTELTRLSCW